MKKTILKHLTINGFVKGDDLTNCELLEDKLALAKDKLKLAKQEVSKVKQELNTAVEKSLKKIENEKKELKNIKNNESGESKFSSVVKMEEIKTKYDAIVAELEIKKNEMKKKIDAYKADGTEKLESFKHKLNHDLEELGKALKGFTMHAG